MQSCALYFNRSLRLCMLRSKNVARRVHQLTRATSPDPFNALLESFGAPKSTKTSSHSPLCGLKYAVKANICTRIGSTTCASDILGASSSIGYQSPFDATCIKLLDEAGAQMTGKTNMDEFGMGSFTTNTPHGSTLNPYNREHTAGGSSGGSAAALHIQGNNQQDFDFSLGTDTGGSIRVPASYCGLYGFKPSYGRISRFGVIPYANSLDTVGMLVASTELSISRLHQIFSVLDKYDYRDPTSLKNDIRVKIKSLTKVENQRRTIRIGVPDEYYVSELSGDVLNVWRDCLGHLAEATRTNVEIVPVSLTLTESALAAYYILSPAEVSSNLQKYSGVFYGHRAEEDYLEDSLYAATRASFGTETKNRILMGCASLSADSYANFYLQAQKIRRMIVTEFNSVFRLEHPLLPSPAGSVDYLLTPSCPTVAPANSDIAHMSAIETHAVDVMTVPASMAGLPALSIPYGQDSRGLPIGLQLIGQYGDDEGVIQAARLFT